MFSHRAVVTLFRAAIKRTRLFWDCVWCLDEYRKYLEVYEHAMWLIPLPFINRVVNEFWLWYIIGKLAHYFDLSSAIDAGLLRYFNWDY